MTMFPIPFTSKGLAPPYRLYLKVGKNLPLRVVDFRQYATLFVAVLPLNLALSSYCKKLYECAVIKKLSVIFFLHAPLYFRPL